MLQDMASASPGRAIVAKLDCEGAKYGIWRRLAGWLQKMTAFMLEGHRKPDGHTPQGLIQVHQEGGLAVLCRLDVNGPVGMLYAFLITDGKP